MDADDSPFDPDAEFPLTEELELHGLPPRLIPELVESYLEEAVRAGFAHVRIIHGKGIGVQRERVQSILARSRYVTSFGDAPSERGGWGATVVNLVSATGLPPRR